MKIERDDWLVLSALLDDALALAAESRMAWLATLQGVEPRIVAMLGELIAGQARVETSDFLQELPDLQDLEDRIGGAAALGPGPGSTVGAYVLEAEIGRGGMARVWRARRIDRSPDRIVALKLPFVGIFTGNLLERYFRERDILATLEHPNIGRLYEAGIAETGQPYLALQYIDGLNIIEYCTSHGLSLAQRLGLFKQVLAAVQYAHSRLVIHRDLKPSNILVSASGQVHLLDFGIAKLLSPEPAQAGLLTEIDGTALTLYYAAPEQLTGGAVTTATDVYALGVILYELLTGTRPYRPLRASRGAIEEAVLTGQVPAPSSAGSAVIGAAGDILAAAKWSRQLRGDLDTVILKAMKRARAERYASVDAFRSDLDNHAAGRPVSAQPDSRLYRASRFIARNSILVLSLSCVIASLAIGLGVALWQTKQARAEAHRAETEAQIATAVEAFMANIFRASSTAQADPLKAQAMTARELLDRGAEQVTTDLQAAPQAELRALKILADTYKQLGIMEKGVQLNRARVALAGSQYGDNALELAYALIDLSESLTWAEDERGLVLGEATRIMDLHGENTSQARGRLLRQLALHAAVLHQSSAALGYYDQAIALHRVRNEPIETMHALIAKGALLQYVARDDAAAVKVLSEAAELCDSIAAACADDVPQLYAYRGDVRVNTGDIPGAEADYGRALSSVIMHKGAEHTDTIEVQYRLGKMLFDSGRTAEGLRTLKNTLERAAAAKGAEDSFHAAHIKSSYARRLMQMGFIETGLQLAQEAQIDYQRYRPSNPLNSEHLDGVILGLVAEGRYAEADRLSAEASAPLAALTANDPLVINHNRFAAQAALASGRAQQALNLAVLAQTIDLKAAAGSLSPAAAADELMVAECELAAGDPHGAAARAQALREKIQASTNRRYYIATEGGAALVEGIALGQQQRAPDALPLLRFALQLLSSTFDGDFSPMIARAQIALAECEADLGDLNEAARLASAAAAIHSRHARLGPQFSKPLRALQLRLGRSNHLS